MIEIYFFLFCCCFYCFCLFCFCFQNKVSTDATIAETVFFFQLCDYLKGTNILIELEVRGLMKILLGNFLKKIGNVENGENGEKIEENSVNLYKIV